jgi:hypothetical protein
MRPVHQLRSQATTGGGRQNVLCTYLSDFPVCRLR